jgi:hypothetical protein
MSSSKIVVEFVQSFCGFRIIPDLSKLDTKLL